METKKLEVRKLLNDKKFWVASFLIAWAAALQGHMMWLKRQDSFKQKFGTTHDQNINNQDDNQDSIASTDIFEDNRDKTLEVHANVQLRWQIKKSVNSKKSDIPKSNSKVGQSWKPKLDGNLSAI